MDLTFLAELGLDKIQSGAFDGTWRKTKGDELMSALVEFAEKYQIKNAHFSGVGAIDKGLFGWTDVERSLGCFVAYERLERKLEKSFCRPAALISSAALSGFSFTRRPIMAIAPGF